MPFYDPSIYLASDSVSSLASYPLVEAKLESLFPVCNEDVRERISDADLGSRQKSTTVGLRIDVLSKELRSQAAESTAL